MTKPCKIHGCKEMSGYSGTAKGLCRSHYKRLTRYGDPEVELRKADSWKGQTCHFVGCDREIYGLGLCSMHHARQRRKIDPAAEKKRHQDYRNRQIAKQVAVAGRPKPETCEICNSSEFRIVWDHCHAEGHFRGWICDRCNRVLGIVRDSPSLLRNLASYLEVQSGKIDYCGKKCASRQ
jgi:hypothetical protein